MKRSVSVDAAELKNLLAQIGPPLSEWREEIRDLESRCDKALTETPLFVSHAYLFGFIDKVSRKLVKTQIFSVRNPTLAYNHLYTVILAEGTGDSFESALGHLRAQFEHDEMGSHPGCYSHLLWIKAAMSEYVRAEIEKRPPDFFACEAEYDQFGPSGERK